MSISQINTLRNTELMTYNVSRSLSPPQLVLNSQPDILWAMDSQGDTLSLTLLSCFCQTRMNPTFLLSGVLIGSFMK